MCYKFNKFEFEGKKFSQLHNSSGIIIIYELFISNKSKNNKFNT